MAYLARKVHWLEDNLANIPPHTVLCQPDPVPQPEITRSEGVMPNIKLLQSGHGHRIKHAHLCSTTINKSKLDR
jgi:hypothetical protein